MTDRKMQHWLNRWVNQIKDKTALELGCGEGLDTAVLAKIAGLLVSADLRSDRLLKVKAVNGRLIRLDHSVPLPFEAASFEIIVAGLSLHYFDWFKTELILREIERVLKPQGRIFTRLNSTADVLHGAGEGDEIGINYYQVPFGQGVQSKRFFTGAECEQLFTGWHLEHLEESRFEYYGSEKVAWEVVATKP